MQTRALPLSIGAILLLIVTACSDGAAGEPQGQPTGLRVGYGSPMVAMGEGVTVYIEAQPVNAAGEVIGPPVVARYTSSDTSVAVVDSAGARVNVTGRRAGTAVVTAVRAVPGATLRGQVKVSVYARW